jgi:exopolysaccharide biosynthesis polyprenyl glycosylphosphotransferase
MLKRQRQLRAQMQKLVDASLFCFALWVAHAIRVQARLEVFGGTAEIQPFEEYRWLLLIVFPITPLLLEMQGFYVRPMLPARSMTAWQLLKGCALSTVVLVSAMFLFREQLARSVIVLFPLIAFAFVFAKEEMLHHWVRSKFGQEQLKRRLILLGTEQDTARLATELKDNGHAAVEIVAKLNLNETSVEKLVEMLHSSSANGVILSAKHTFFGEIEKAIQACELEGVEAWLMADFFNTQVSQTTMDDFFGRPMLVFRATPEESWPAVVKLVIDFFGALSLLIITSPLMVAAAIMIRLTSPGPILFKQSRSGLNGRPFTMLKFRSMVTDAEQRQQELAAMNEMAGPVFKVTHDPRITAIGRILRKYSIDELPQLVNVLKGEMSLVGPRPLPVGEVMRFNDLAHRRRLSVKPGLTCLWQVSGRNNVTDFGDWVRLDLEYIDNWSLWLDFKILLRTIPVVIFGTGAK